MVTNFLKTRKYRQVPDEYERWFLGMAAAAEATRTPLQLCMALPSDAILSAKADWATNARASDDYALPVNLPQFGGGALLLWALGLRPSKDTFWTTSNSTKRAYAAGANPGTDVELNALVAATSTGPVGISDAAGETDAALVAAASARSGALLQPLKPMTPLDRTYATSWTSGGRVWGSHAAVGDAEVYLTLSMAVAGDDAALEARDLYPPTDAAAFLHREWHAPRCDDGAPAAACGVSAAFPGLRSTDRGEKTPFDYHLTYPVRPGSDWLLLGELAKFVPIAPSRFLSVGANATGLTVDLRGAPGEVVAVTALRRDASSGWVARVREARFVGDRATVVFATN